MLRIEYVIIVELDGPLSIVVDKVQRLTIWWYWTQSVSENLGSGKYFRPDVGSP